ncbi:hypothetical protein [Pseudoalteromonas sp. S2755]|uniref:hypothetical protein n=1 Tax=Pseudoalteromonas sp. S2755 TaxID=2066523 RepID=UPI00110AD1C6|nr:hypothetical protein [Pseudoalteromonas sp. S2755]TMN35345.1 hypothetical protein CWC03_15495 [Pseudoalteromonas sp. S2755]
MKSLLRLASVAAIILGSNQVLALPTVIMGETINLSKQDFVTIKAQYGVVGGEVQYAETGYEFPFKTLTIGASNILDFNLSGAVNSAWYSSNFAMDFKLYCEGVLVSEDRAFGVRYQQVSYSARPYIVGKEVSLPSGCLTGKLVLTKVGSLSRAFYTRIQDISLNMTINKVF